MVQCVRHFAVSLMTKGSAWPDEKIALWSLHILLSLTYFVSVFYPCTLISEWFLAVYSSFHYTELILLRIMITFTFLWKLSKPTPDYISLIVNIWWSWFTFALWFYIEFHCISSASNFKMGFLSLVTWLSWFINIILILSEILHRYLELFNSRYVQGLKLDVEILLLQLEKIFGWIAA